jgi:hypothetical protein
MAKDKSKEHKTIFDDTFSYVKVPIEVLLLPGLRADDMMILSRIIFWTRKGMPCTHTNAQFAELIKKSEATAKRAISKLKRLHCIDVYLWGDAKKKRKDCNREITALVGVEYEMVVKRMAKNAERERRKKCGKQAKNKGGQVTSAPVLLQNRNKGGQVTSDQRGSAPVTRGVAHPRSGTTIKQLRTTIAETPPTPDRQAKSPQKTKTENITKNVEQPKFVKLGLRPPKISMTDAEYAAKRERDRKALLEHDKARKALGV